MKYDFLLFDMDGMLVDTREGILKCAAHALSAFGIEVEDLSSLTKFVGPPLSYSFTEFYGLSPEDAQKAVAIYRERYSAKGQYECYVFDGVPEMLQALLKKGYRLCIATSKLESYAKAMLDRLGIGCYFEQVIGATPDEAISTKDEVIEASLVRMGIADRRKALMIGDRKHDVLGAKKCGLDSFGVYMGCAEESEHEAAGATYIANSIQSLQDALLAF
ncbi:MAG: HAD hydrolase-like protein [Clostridia bacterium]|nr:HAD hydrolase-like protein [Clostridia bacterium]MBO7157566.1 HAD hydrolase-like protein [Clostridia bacterium]